jgi:hypothetical protein
MQTNRNIARATIVAALLSLISGCMVAHNNSLESERSSQNQLSANDYANRCGEQTALLKHEIALCRSVPLITMPLTQ